MQVNVAVGSPSDETTPMMAACFFQFQAGEELIDGAKALDTALNGLITRLRQNGDFVGSEGEILLFYTPSGSFSAERMLLIGFGRPQRLQSRENATGRWCSS